MKLHKVRCGPRVAERGQVKLHKVRCGPRVAERVTSEITQGKMQTSCG